MAYFVKLQIQKLLLRLEHDLVNMQFQVIDDNLYGNVSLPTNQISLNKWLKCKL